VSRTTRPRRQALRDRGAEIANGIVEIKALAREPGHRSKIAVASNDHMIDRSVRAWARRSRVRNITNELRSERIDVCLQRRSIEFIQAALQPARVREVRLDETEASQRHRARQQLSLAIGKEGQNADWPLA